MLEIWKNEHIKSVSVIEYWPATSSVESNLQFVCNLLARRLSGGVLVI